jgi:hypothetical protein
VMIFMTYLCEGDFIQDSRVPSRESLKLH